MSISIGRAKSYLSLDETAGPDHVYFLLYHPDVSLTETKEDVERQNLCWLGCLAYLRHGGSHS